MRDEVTVICNKMKASPNTGVAKLKERLGTIDVQLQQAFAIKDMVVAVEKALDHTSQRIDDIYRAPFPALSHQVDQAAVGLALQTLVAGDLLSTHGVTVTIASWAVQGPASF